MAELSMTSEQADTAQTVANSMPVNTSSVIEVLVWLAVVVGLILASAWFFRRFSGINTSGVGLIKVLTAISLGSRDRIALIQAGDKQILLGISPGRINTLHVFDEPVMQVSQVNDNKRPYDSTTPDFARKLQGLLGKGRNNDVR